MLGFLGCIDKDVRSLGAARVLRVQRGFPGCFRICSFGCWGFGGGYLRVVQGSALNYLPKPQKVLGSFQLRPFASYYFLSVRAVRVPVLGGSCWVTYSGGSWARGQGVPH